MSIESSNFHKKCNKFAALFGTEILHSQIMCYNTSHRKTSTIFGNITMVRTIKSLWTWNMKCLTLWNYRLCYFTWVTFSLLKNYRILHENDSIDFNSLRTASFYICTYPTKSQEIQRWKENLVEFELYIFYGFLYKTVLYFVSEKKDLCRKEMNICRYFT